MPAHFPSRRRLALVALLLPCVGLSAPAASHDSSKHAGTNLSRLGKVEFKVECASVVEADFNRAMALYHSFAWDDAMKAFDGIAKADPRCGMAHWGRAMVMLDNPFIWPGNLQPAKLNEVATALAAARTAGLKSQREKDYVEAAAVFVRDHEKVAYPARLNAFDDAMSKLAGRYADDKEAAIISALITSANFNPADKTYANQLKAAKVLEPLFAAQPNHPGVAHYLIHSYDYPPIANKGLEAAKRYADIAPDAPHALHMPSHIFTRVGHWQDSIKANRASAKAAGDATFDAHHAYDYMVYAHLQLGQDKAAREAMSQSRSMKLIEHFGAAFAYAAMPARIALERANWKEAANLPLHPKADAYPWSRYPQAEAINAFARGVGSARSGDIAGAKKEHARLLALRDAAKERKLTYWVEQIDIQADVVHGLTVLAEGKPAEGTELLKAAAAREDATEKHAVTPGPLLPARELLADVSAGGQEGLRGSARVRGRAGQGAEPLSRHHRSGQSGAAGRRRKESTDLHRAAIATSQGRRCAAQARADRAIEQEVDQARKARPHCRRRGASRLQHGGILERPGHRFQVGRGRYPPTRGSPPQNLRCR